MSQATLQGIINNFDLEEFKVFFRKKNPAFKPTPQESPVDPNNQNFELGKKLGIIPFDDSELILVSFKTKRDLSKRSGKKAQYKVGKKVLKEQQSDAGIFIFHDDAGNFRFSLVYSKYFGKKRDWNSFRRFTYLVSPELTNKTFLRRIGDGDFLSLEAIKAAFAVEPVTEEFYEAIANWYFWAVRNCRFPKDAEEEDNGRKIAVLRLITRLIFIWFMRERGLVSKELFEEQWAKSVLVNIDQDKSTYYHAILQNLFFATLSTEIDERQFRSDIRGHKGYNPDFGNQYVFRYHNLFSIPEEMANYFSDIPFLNGGLFECLDDGGDNKYVDGFTRRRKYQPVIPNYLFFGAERAFDLNQERGTENKTYMVQGLLNTLSSFNFTIDENSPDDADIALDPELLGKVFENLLAEFNPETAASAQKASGSYYTPRPIVNYMVTESLKGYFKTHLSGIEEIDQKFDTLFSDQNEINPFNANETQKLVELIESVRIVDPAVGSGAFPMGTLNRMVFILNKIDPGNKLWEQAQLEAAEAIPDQQVRRDIKKRIEEFFKTKGADYGRKLYLIQKCIYGVDSQKIAVEITKLRFFISLLVDEEIDESQPNWGIQPLPNLDFKIMQGDSLISEFLGIDFDKGSLKQAQTKMIRDAEDDLIDEFEQRKIKFQNEPDRNKKSTFKDEIEDLMIKILKTRIQKQKTDSSRRIKEIKEKYATIPDKERREEIVAEETRKIYEGADVEKQFREFTSKNRTRPFFPWKLYFAEVFKQGGFDIVTANPPYVRYDSGPKHLEYIKELKKSKTYQTLYEKFDLYIPFIERGFQILKNSGVLEYIIPDAYMASKYATKSHDYFLENASINRVNFLSDFKVFEASVRNIIIELKKEPNLQNVPLKIKHSPTFNDHIKLPSNKQTEMGALTFKLESEKNELGNLGNTVEWGEICYVSYGLRPNSDERYWRGEFKKADLISNKKDASHPKAYVEGKWLKKYGVKFVKYLEWDTDRSPSKLVRPTFPELYLPAKIMMGRMTAVTYDTSGLLCNDSVIVSVLWKDLYGVDNRSILNSIRTDFKPKYVQKFRSELEEKSKKFNLKYLVAILSSKFGQYYLDKARRSQLGFYPNDLKKLPIKKVSEVDQKPFIDLVDKILATTGDVSEYEKEIDCLVYKLYGLTKEEVEFVEGYHPNSQDSSTAD